MQANLTELHNGIFVAEVMGAFAVNVGVVLGDDGVCVIDTGTTQSDAETIAKTVARVTSKPITYIINTHHHGDHSFGNWWLRPAVAVGHHRCRLRLVGEAGEKHREMLARMVPQAAEQISAVIVDPPAVTFEEEMSLHLGNASLRLQYLGRAHTDNDIATTVEATGHCFAGDLIEEAGPPVAFESFPRDWGPTLRNLIGTGASSYIPGHGRAVDEAFVAGQAAAFEDLDAACSKVQAEGGTEADAPLLLQRETRDLLQSQVQPAIARHFAARQPDETSHE